VSATNRRHGIHSRRGTTLPARLFDRFRSGLPVLASGVAALVVTVAGTVTSAPASASPTLPALSVSHFVIVDPTGSVTVHSGPVTLAPGSGEHLFVFDTVGYRISVINTSKVLVPGQYSTSVDTWLALVNDPACEGGSTTGSVQVDQATYDPTGSVTSAAIQFEFRCYTGTYVYGTIAYQLGFPTGGAGYYLFGGSGAISGYGNSSYLSYLGTPWSQALGTQVVGMAVTPDRGGDVMAATDGGVFAYGDAGFYGSMAGKPFTGPAVGIAETPSGLGYWLVASDGGIFAFGDAGFYGSMGAKPLNRAIVGMAPTPDGRGYWLVASDGGIFAFGDAGFYGSMGGRPLNEPIVGMARTPDGQGYWLVASDGGIFAFGDAGFYGSMGGTSLNAPVVGMTSTVSGRGYSMAAADGGVFTFGDAVFRGSAVSSIRPLLVIGITAG
jgi:hypothetical protein